MSRLSGPLLLASLLLSVAVMTALVYAYAFVLPQHIGFEKTLLLGIAMIALQVSNSD